MSAIRRSTPRPDAQALQALPVTDPSYAVTPSVEEPGCAQRRRAQRRATGEARNGHCGKRLERRALAGDCIGEDFARIGREHHAETGEATGVIKPRGKLANERHPRGCNRECPAPGVIEAHALELREYA